MQLMVAGQPGQEFQAAVPPVGPMAPGQRPGLAPTHPLPVGELPVQDLPQGSPAATLQSSVQVSGRNTFKKKRLTNL